MVDVTMGLKRAQIDKLVRAWDIKGKTQDDLVKELPPKIKEWMKKTKYPFDTVAVTAAGKEDFKVVVKLKKEAKEVDAEKIRSFITGHAR